MIRIGKYGKVDEVAYAEWPCFNEFRETDEFITGFTEIFGDPPTAIQQIDNDQLNTIVDEQIDNTANSSKVSSDTSKVEEAVPAG